MNNRTQVFLQTTRESLLCQCCAIPVAMETLAPSGRGESAIAIDASPAI